MPSSDDYVRARIDPDLKAQASAALKKVGLTPSLAIRLLFMRVAAEGRMPFDIATPHAGSDLPVVTTLSTK